MTTMTTMKIIELLVRVSVDAPSNFDPKMLKLHVSNFDPKMLELHVKNCGLLDLTEGTASKNCYITEIETLDARSL